NVLSRTILDALPLTKNFASLAAVTVGAVGTRDVAGSAGDRAASIRIHGGRDAGIVTFDGMNVMSPLNNGTTLHISPNQAVVQEMVLQTGGMGAEAETGGAAVNIVPKDGGNRFSGVLNSD